MNFKLDTSTRRIAFAIFISVLLHAFVMWGPHIQLPKFGSSLPTLTAKLEALPDAPVRPKSKRKPKPPAPKPIPAPIPETPAPPPEVPQVVAEPVVASAPVAAETIASTNEKVVERPPLPQHAQLSFDVLRSGFRGGEVIQTLDIEDGRYVLKALWRTVGFVRMVKSYERNQYSSGTYSKYGLQPELFTEEIKDSLSTQLNAVEFDHEAHLARFSHGGEVALPAETQDFLSFLYQFPPLRGLEITSMFVSNGKKIEQYQLDIASNEEIDTPMGKLLAVRLRKMHGPNEEGLEIWLAREYRLFPIKIRIIDKNGDVSAEAIITDIRVSEEEGVRKDVTD